MSGSTGGNARKIIGSLSFGSDDVTNIKTKISEAHLTMNKESERLLGVASILLLFTLLLLVAHGRIHRLEGELEAYRNAPADTVTVIKHDTIKIAEPVPVYKYIKEKEYITITDSLLIHDTVAHIIELPREYLVYKDTSYRAVVSGIQPKLDSIEVYQNTVTNIITQTVEVKKKPKISITAGPGVSWDGKNFKPSLQITAGLVIKSW